MAEIGKLFGGALRTAFESSLERAIRVARRIEPTCQSIALPAQGVAQVALAVEFRRQRRQPLLQRFELALLLAGSGVEGLLERAMRGGHFAEPAFEGFLLGAQAFVLGLDLAETDDDLLDLPAEILEGGTARLVSFRRLADPFDDRRYGLLRRRIGDGRRDQHGRGTQALGSSCPYCPQDRASSGCGTLARG